MRKQLGNKAAPLPSTTSCETETEIELGIPIHLKVIEVLCAGKAGTDLWHRKLISASQQTANASHLRPAIWLAT